MDHVLSDLANSGFRPSPQARQVVFVPEPDQGADEERKSHKLRRWSQEKTQDGKESKRRQRAT
jgi:hypothetical protein